MSVSTPPRRPEVERDSELERRVSDLEALIEEARRRARRRRQRTAAVMAVATLVGAAVLIGFGGHGGNATGTTALAGTGKPLRTPTNGQPLGALPPATGFVESFAFDPHNPRIVYLLTRGGVVKTIDGGAHWQTLPGTVWAGGYQTLAPDPRHPGTVYAGTGVGVFKTSDGGRSWQRSTRGLLIPHWTDRIIGWVTALAVDPANTNIVYAGSNRINKSSDGGRTWKPVFTPEPIRDVNTISVSALAVAPTHPESVYAIRADARTGHTSIYKSTDAGKTWQMSTSVPGILHGFVTDLAVDPHDPTTVYAAIGGAVLKTTDAGNHWQPIGHGLPVAAGLPRAGCHCRDGVTTFAIDPRRSRTVYAGVNQGGIYQTTNGGQSWKRVAAKETYYSTTIVGVDPEQPTTVYASGIREQDDLVRLFRSTNGGRTWATAP